MGDVAESYNSTASTVFNLPELIPLVASYLSRTDTNHLSQTCRRAFMVLVPLIWQKVDDAQYLLKLIESTTFHYEVPSGGDTPQLKQVILNEHAHTAKFERFDFYARFVLELDVYSASKTYYGVSGWPLLMIRSQEQPLLPRLKRLSIASVDYEAEPAAVAQWIMILGSESLIDFSWSITDHSSHDPIWVLDHIVTATIMESLVNQCPNIQRIMPCPRNFDDPLGPDPLLLDNYKSSKLWYDYFARLPSLNHLSITRGWLSQSCLFALSKHPNLESLEIEDEDSQGFGGFFGISIESLDGAFPALRHLSLRRVTAYCCEILFEVRPIFSRIENLEIELRRSDEETIVPHDIADSAILPALTDVPCLKKLRISTSEMDECPLLIVQPESLDVMRQIPLQVFDVDNISIGKGPFLLDLGTVWPHLTELILPRQYASLRELAYFAALPNLTRLVLELHLTTMFTPQNIPVSDHSPLEKIASSEGGSISASSETINHHANVLHSLWPNLRRVRWSPCSAENFSLANSLGYQLRILSMRRSILLRTRN